MAVEGVWFVWSTALSVPMHNEQLKLAHLLARFILLALQALVVAMNFPSHKDATLSKEVLVIGCAHIEDSFWNAIRLKVG